MAAERQIDPFEIGKELGRMAEASDGLRDLFDQHCRDDDRRHAENVKLLTANNEAIASLEKRFVEKLAVVTPAGEFLSRKQLALLAFVGTGVVVVIGWIAEAFIKWAVGWVISVVVKTKLGG